MMKFCPCCGRPVSKVGKIYNKKCIECRSKTLKSKKKTLKELKDRALKRIIMIEKLQKETVVTDG